jgi:threonine dehydratase
MNKAPTLADVTAAAGRLRGVAARTPVLTSRLVDQACGAEVFVKAECFQRTGSFKFRGAFNRVSTLSDEERRRGVAAASSGNHAQALARAAQLFGCTAVVLMPRTAPSAKLAAAAETYGAEVIAYDDPAERDAMLQELVRARGVTEVPSSNHRDVMAGQGTVALELFEDVADIDALVVPIAGGGLLGGCATVAGAVSPGTRVIGVEPFESPDMRDSLAAGVITPCVPGPSIADALKLHAPSSLGFEVCLRLVPPDQVVLVSNEEIRAALRLLCERTKLMVEPAGAVALAAVLAGRIPSLPVGARVAVIASGGNVGLDRLSQILAN